MLFVCFFMNRQVPNTCILKQYCENISLASNLLFTYFKGGKCPLLYLADQLVQLGHFPGKDVEAQGMYSNFLGRAGRRTQACWTWLQCCYCRFSITMLLGIYTEGMSWMGVGAKLGLSKCGVMFKWASLHEAIVQFPWGWSVDLSYLDKLFNSDD